MTRWTLRIIPCLILGAITTVAVAWAVGFLPLGSMYGEFATRQEVMQRGDLLWVVERASVAGSDLFRSETMWVHIESSFGESEALLDLVPSWAGDLHDQMNGRWEEHHVFRIAQGWPVVAVWAEQGPTRSAYEYEVRSGSVSRHQPRWTLENTYHLQRQMPFLPIWPGFVIDTLFYAAIWFGVFFGFASAKRAIRRKRGRCPCCGYDLRGALENGCSECGWQREEKAA